MIVDTLNAVPLLETAAKRGCIVDTVFHMRHRFLLLLEQLIYEQPLVLEGIIEIDQTYVYDGYKGNKRVKSYEPSFYDPRYQNNTLK